MVLVEVRRRRAAGNGRAPAAGRAQEALALAAWGGLVAAAHLWGRHLLDAGHRLQLGLGDGAPPIVGQVDPRIGLRVLPALAVVAMAVAAGPSLAARLGWRRLLVASAVGAAGVAVALAVVDPGGLTRGLLGRGEYLRNVDDVGSPLEFLRQFTERLRTYHTHVQGHPPAMLLTLWGLDRIGLGGAGWAAALVIGGGAAAVPATLVTVRAVAGEAPARTAAPFLVLAPAAIWVASSADGLYTGVVATGIALLALAGGGGAGAPADAAMSRQAKSHGQGGAGAPADAAMSRQAKSHAIGAGVVLGAACFFSYGAVLAAPIAAGVALAQRRLRPLVVAATAALAVALAFAAAGFWWLEGLGATREAYFAGVASRRPYGYFLVANLAAFALVLGPAVAVALTRLATHRRSTPAREPGAGEAGLTPLWPVVGGALVAVLLADVSGLSKGEVERIWLPFAPWVLAAAATLGRAPRGWLALQGTTALVLAVSVRTPW